MRAITYFLLHFSAFASSPEYNFVVVDWSYFNGHFNPIPGLVGLVFGYIDSMIKLPAAGEALAQFLNFLRIHKQIEFSDITFLTHSMGCHGKKICRINFKLQLSILINFDISILAS